MFDKLSAIEERYNELSEKVSDPAVIADSANFAKLCKEQSDIAPIVEKYKEYKTCKDTISEGEEIIADPDMDKEMKELAEEEIKDAKDRIEELSKELKILLLPKDPNDDKSVIVEIRGGAGGDEAALFAGDLFRMFTMYAESNRWKTEILSSNPTSVATRKFLSASKDRERTQNSNLSQAFTVYREFLLQNQAAEFIHQP